MTIVWPASCLVAKSANTTTFHVIAYRPILQTPAIYLVCTAHTESDQSPVAEQAPLNQYFQPQSPTDTNFQFEPVSTPLVGDNMYHILTYHCTASNAHLTRRPIQVRTRKNSLQTAKKFTILTFNCYRKNHVLNHVNMVGLMLA